ncbi:hypothetical protein [Romeriopsis navalis]
MATTAITGTSCRTEKLLGARSCASGRPIASVASAPSHRIVHKTAAK